jgi:hypothetical protein
MIVRRGGFGDITTTITVDPLTAAVPSNVGGAQLVGPAGGPALAAPQNGIAWWWLLVAAAAGLAVGWWLTGDSARSPLS